MKRELTLWENIFANDTSDKGLISKICKELIQLNTRTTNNPIKTWAKDLNRHFAKEDIQWPIDIWKKCSISLAIREKQIKTTMTYHLIIARMTVINKSTNNKYWWGCGERGTLVLYWWECWLAQPLWKTVWNFLKNLKMELPYDPATPLLGLIERNLKH